ncbi:MAG TPA: matrixin family metalloprotease, partial [Armatimonadota bacterium]|nr:matrixin family metalloprotease [Armatimonadota bacterium]
SGGSGSGTAAGTGAASGSGGWGTAAPSTGTSYLNHVLESGSVRRWTKSQIRVAIDTSSVPAGWQAYMAQYVVEGCQEWARESGGAFTVAVVNGGVGDVNVRWVDSISSSGGGLVTGVTRISMTSSYFWPPDVELALRAGGMTLPDAELETTAIHEIGHALGMAGHSPGSQDVMYYASTAADLTGNDIATLHDLYSRTAEIADAPAWAAGVRGTRTVSYTALWGGGCTRHYGGHAHP